MPFNLLDFRRDNPEYADWATEDLVGQLYQDNPELQQMGLSINDFALNVNADEDKRQLAQRREAERIANLPNRGIIGEAIATVPRTARESAAMGLKASRFFLPKAWEPTKKYISEVEAPLKSPDYPYRPGRLMEKEGIAKNLLGGLETTEKSLFGMVPGALAGAALGGGIPGVIGGAAFGGGMIFGAAEHFDFMKEAHDVLDPIYIKKYQKQGLSEADAREKAVAEIEDIASPQAIKSGLIEAGGEGASDLLDLLVFRGVGKAAKGVIGNRIKSKLIKPLAKYAANTLGTAAVEIPTEAFQGYEETKARAPIYKAAGLKPPSPREAAIESAKQMAYSAPFFGLLGFGARGGIEKPMKSSADKVVESNFDDKTVEDETEKIVAQAKAPEIPKGMGIQMPMATNLLPAGQGFELRSEYQQPPLTERERQARLQKNAIDQELAWNRYARRNPDKALENLMAGRTPEELSAQAGLTLPIIKQFAERANKSEIAKEAAHEEAIASDVLQSIQEAKKERAGTAKINRVRKALQGKTKKETQEILKRLRVIAPNLYRGITENVDLITPAETSAQALEKELGQAEATLQSVKGRDLLRQKLMAEQEKEAVPTKEAITPDILTKTGKPFKNKGSLNFALNKQGLSDTHEPVKTDNGWVGRLKEKENVETLEGRLARPEREGKELGRPVQEQGAGEEAIGPGGNVQAHEGEGGAKPNEAEVAGAEKGKQPWEMTHQEYMYSVFPKLKPENIGPSIFKPTKETHRLAVQKALKEGKPVPKEVLAEYPDLAPAQPIPKAEKAPERPPKQALKEKTKYPWGININTYPPSLAGNARDGYRVFGADKYNTEIRAGWAKERIADIKTDLKHLHKTAATAQMTGSQWELRNERALKTQKIKDLKQQLVAWEKEIEAPVETKKPTAAQAIQKQAEAKKQEAAGYKIEPYQGTQVGYGKPGRRGSMERTRKIKGFMVTEPDGYQRIFDTKKEAQKWIKDQRGIEAKKQKATEKIKIEGQKEKTVSADLTKKEEASLKPKEQKAYLLAEIDKAIAGAEKGQLYPAGINEDDSAKEKSDKAAIAYNLNLEEYGTVTIHVPNDGDFTLINHKKSLGDFKIKAKKFPLSAIGAKRKQAGTKPTQNRLAEFEGEYYNKFVPRKQKPVEENPKDNDGKIKQYYYPDGWFVTGTYGIKFSKKPKFKFPIETENKPNLKNVLSDVKKAKKAKIYGETLTSTDVEPKGINPPKVHIASVDGKIHHVFDAKYIDAILTEHPDADVSIIDGGAAFFKKGKEIIGVAMAMRVNHRGKPGTFEAMQDIVQQRFKELYRKAFEKAISEGAEEKTQYQIEGTEEASPQIIQSFSKLNTRFKNAQIEEALPGLSYKIKLPQGVSFRLDFGDTIEASEKILSHYGKKTLGKTEVVAGRFIVDNRGRRIELSKYATQNTYDHEIQHFLEDIKAFNPIELTLLNKHAVKNGLKATSEGRAKVLADAIGRRDNLKGIQKIIDKIKDFLDAIVNRVGIQTFRGIQREFEGGKVFERGMQKEANLATQPEQYSIKDITEKAKDEVKSTIAAIKDKAGVEREWGFLSRVFKTMEYAKDKVGKLVFKANQERPDKKYELFNDLDTIKDEQVSETIRNLRGVKGMGRLGKIEPFDMSKYPEKYQQLAEMIDFMDVNEQKWKGPKGWRKVLVGKGIDKEIIKAIDEFRESKDKALDLLMKPIKESVDDIDKAGEKQPVIFNETDEKGKKKPVTLKDVYHRMGQLKGFYAPRIREDGDYVIRAKDKKGIFYSYRKASSRAAHKWKLQLARNGYSDIKISHEPRLPESVLKELSISDVASVLDAALKNVKGVDSETQTRLRMESIQAAADMLKSRGYKQHGIARRGRGGAGGVVRGYILDPELRHTIYNYRIAGGVAKGEAAIKMFNALVGEYKKYKRVDNNWVLTDDEGTELDRKPLTEDEAKSKKKVKSMRYGGLDLTDPNQAESYEVYKKYIAEQLRNPDRYDRMVNTGKALVSFKYLGFNPRSALVNVTAMFTTVPTAIHQYAMGGKGSLLKIGVALQKAGRDYIKVMRGKSLKNVDEQAFMDENHKYGYDNPQLTRDAISVINGVFGKAWTKLMSGSMKMFSVSERWNRGTTMLAAYRLARKKGVNHEEAMELARTASDRAHGIYGKETYPLVAMGDNPAAKIAQMGYTYLKFPHNYVQMLYDVGFNKKNIKAFAFGLAAPVVLGGTSALLFKDLLFGIISAMTDRDPEKVFNDAIRKGLGTGAEKVVRHGLLGAMGLDISSSLAIGMELPRTLSDLAGPFGGVVGDIGKGLHFAKTGQVGRAIEEISPNVLANVMQGLRELNGAVTTSGHRVWDENGKPYIPTISETIRKIAGVRSTGRATLQERQWESKREVAKFAEKRNLIYERYRAYLSDKRRSPDEFKEIMDEVQLYNEKVRKLKRLNLIPLITRQSMKNQVRKMMKPTKRQKALAA